MFDLITEILSGNVDIFDEIFPTELFCGLRTRDFFGHFEYDFAQCLLPRNQIHPYLFLIIWFWLILDLTIKVLTMIWTNCCMIPCLQMRLFKVSWHIDKMAKMYKVGENGQKWL